MIIDGTVIAHDVLKETAKLVRRLNTPVTLAVIVVGADPVIESFVSLKMKKAAEAGIALVRADFKSDATESAILSRIREFATDDAIAGIVVQLPLPAHLDTGVVCNAVPPEKDPDMLSAASIERLAKGKSPILPPVVGAIKAVLDHEHISLFGKHALVIGKGLLVGAPSAIWLLRQGARVSVADKTTGNLAALAKQADIIISGAGVPGLITPDMLKSGVVLLDAGTSEEGGVVVGDAAEVSAAKCAIFTPVPGGIGPITVATLLRNTVTLTCDTIKK